MFLATTGLPDPDRPLRWILTCATLIVLWGAACAASLSAWSVAWLFQLLRTLLGSLIAPELLLPFFDRSLPPPPDPPPLLKVEIDAPYLDEAALEVPEPEAFLGDAPPAWNPPPSAPLYASMKAQAQGRAEVLTLLSALDSGRDPNGSLDSLFSDTALTVDGRSDPFGDLEAQMTLSGTLGDQAVLGTRRGGEAAGSTRGEGAQGIGVLAAISGTGTVGGLGGDLTPSTASSDATSTSRPDRLTLTSELAPASGARCIVVREPSAGPEARVVRGCPEDLHPIVTQHALNQPAPRPNRVTVIVRPPRTR
ncbi:MAG: hypothetical protein EA397_14980 [Deltaproteobacteria bacterium]|nr:MAG: hypothetical protein EA397_14980 [Deltaproteobacteria bacterium]